MMVKFFYLVRAFVWAPLLLAAGMVQAVIVFDNTPSGGAPNATGMELIRNTVAGSPTGQYVGLRFSSTTPLTNVYARATVAGTGYSLNPLEVADHFIGDLFSTAKTSYWYITIPMTNVNGSFRVELFQGDPAQAGATSLLLSSPYPLQSADADQSAAANKLFSVTTNPATIQLGQNFDVIACYDINSSNGTNVLVNPAATSAFNPINLRLGTTKVEIMTAAGCTGTILSTNNNQLYFVGVGSASTNSVRATYNFTQVGPTAAIATPIATARVGQYKYNDDFATLRTLPTPSNTTVLAKSVDVTESPTGLVVTYTITATNSGASPVTLDKLVDTLPSLPANAIYVAGSSTLNGSAFVNPIIAGQVLTWTNPASPSQSFSVPPNNGTLKLVFKATLPNTNGLYMNRAIAYIGTTQIDTTVALGDNAPAQASTAIGPPNLVVRKIALTPSVTNSTNGTSATYTVAVTNNGTTAAGVQLSDALPAGFTFRATSAPVLSSGATRTSLVDPAVGATAPTWGNFNLLGGASVTITFVVDIASTVANGKYDNSASASSSTAGTILNNFDGSLAANTVDDVTVSTNIALVVTKSAMMPSIANTSIGATATYTLAVTNNGGSNATGVKLIDTLPAGFTYASTSALNLNGSVQASSAFQVLTTGTQTPGTPQWDTAAGTGFTINAGQTLVVTFLANIASTVADGNYNNSASIAPGSNATSISNFDGSVNTSDDVVVTGAILTVTKRANAFVVNMSPDGIANYTVTVTNSGTGTATNVKLTDILATNFNYASTSVVTLNGVVLASNAYQVLTTAPQTASSPQWDTNPSGGFTIHPGQSLLVSFNASLSGNGPNSVPDGTYHNSASVSAAARSISNYNGASAGNNLDDVVVTSADLSASKSTSTPNIVNTASGAVASYTITINNNSSNINAQATAVRVLDALPAGFTYLSTTGVTVNGASTSAYQVITSGAQTSATPMWDTTAGTGFTINGGGTNTLVINFTAKIDSSVADGVYHNSVSTTSNTPVDKVFNYNGTIPANTADDVAVLNKAHLTLSKTHTGNFLVGSNGVYTLAATNIGLVPTSGVVTITDNLPVGLTFVSADNPGTWTCSAAGQVVTCHTSPAFALAEGAASTLNLTVQTVGPAGNVVNSASVSGGNAVLPSAATLDPTVIQSAGVPVSGYVYGDTNHNLQKDAGEGGVAPSLFAKLVPAASPAGPAMQAVGVDAITGLYQFSSISPGEYSIVIDDNNTLTDIAPAILSAWVGTEMPQLRRQNVVLASTELQNLNFGLFNGNTISGRVFVDSGQGSGGIANNGVQDGGEAGLGAVSVKLTDNTGTLVHDSAKTDASGNYLLWVPAALTGSTLKVSETNASGFLSTGASAVAGAVYDRASDSYSLAYALGNNYSGLNFGDVPVNTLLGNQQQSALPGTVVFYSHAFAAGTAGVLSFGVSSASGWPVVLLRDGNCNGVIDSGELPINAPITVAAREKVCVVVRESIPGGAPTNAQDSITLQANFAYTNANPALSDSLANKDLTTVGTPASAGLVLNKVLENPSPLPGATIIYTITYTNNSSAALGNIVLNDSVLAYTSFLSASCVTPLPVSLTACSATTQPAVGSNGAIAWTLGGNLQPSASGQVTFSVRLNP